MVNFGGDTDFQKRLLRWNALIPTLLLGFDWYRGNLGANPPEAFIRTTGILAILFLVLTLAVTPLFKILSWPWLIKHRRSLGLWTFFYASLHLLGYSFFDRSFNVAEIIEDIKKRPFILLGFAAFVMLIPLAITSTNEMIKWLGGTRWKNLHRLTYVVAVAAAIHFWMIVKSDIFYPALFATAFAILLLYRALKRGPTHAGKVNRTASQG